MWYTKQLLFGPHPCSSLVEMLNSSDPPSAPLLLDLTSDIFSLPIVRLPAEPLPELETFVVSKGILCVVAVNSQIYVYDAYLS
jgi:hypothetical protein